MGTTNQRDAHFFLAGWNGAKRDVDANKLFQNVSKTAPASCLHQIEEPSQEEQAAWHAGLDEGRAQAAPAAVAVQLDANGIAPCPLCGSESKHVKADVGGHRILCWNDDCECSSGYFCSKEEAITSWNNRAALAATPANGDSLEQLNENKGLAVMLPEPVAWLANYQDREGNSKYYTSTHKDLAQENDTNGEPQSLFTEQQVRALLAGVSAPAALAVERGEVLVTVSGFTGSGKSAIAGEIEIMCRALGLQVEWPDSDSEKHMTHADWIAALEQYKPRVRIVECNVPHSVVKGQDK